MAKIAVIGGRDSILGFTSMGAEIFPVQNEEEALQRATRLIKEGKDHYSIIFITDDLAVKIDKPLEDLKKSISFLPIIVIIPSHKGSLGLAATKIQEIVKKALGTDILFSK
ncbi:MAG: V-type ATP synthase subunit F [bacterium]